MSFSRAERREVLDFFVSVLQKFDDYVFYENIRTHVHKASAIVRKYVLLNCSGDNLLEYFKRRKYFFEVLKLDVALKCKILKKKKYKNNQRKRNRSQGNSFSLEDAILAEGESVPEPPLTEEEKDRQRNEDVTIKHFTKFLKKHKKVKVDWIGFDEQPTTVKIFLQKYYEKKPRSFFLSYPGDFQIDDEDCVCLRLSQAKPTVYKKCTKSTKPPKSRKLSVKIDPELKKTEDLLNSIKFFVEILRKNALPFPIEKLGGYLSNTTSSVRDHVKFNYRTFRNFLLKNSPKIFLINTEEVSLSDECDKVIGEIEKLLNDAMKNILPEDDITLEDQIDLLLKPKIQQSFSKEENKTESSSNTKIGIGKIKNIGKTEINKTIPVSTSDELIKITSSKNHKDQVEFPLKNTSESNINVKNIDHVCNGENNLKPTSNSLILLHDFTSQKIPNKESALVKPNTVSFSMKDNKNLSYEKVHGPKSPLLVSKNEIPDNDSNSLSNIGTFSSPNSSLTNEKRLKNLKVSSDCIQSIELPLNSNETTDASHNQVVSSSPLVDNLIKTSESNNQLLSFDKTSDPLNSSISHKNDVIDSNSLLEESESVDVLDDKIISFLTVESDSEESSCESIVEDEGMSKLNTDANSKFYDEVPLERPVPRTEKSECIDTLNDDINWLFEYVSNSKEALSLPSMDHNESRPIEDDVINDDMPTFNTEEISEERKFSNRTKESDIVDPLSDNLNLLTVESDSEESNFESLIENRDQYLENTSQNNIFTSPMYHKEKTPEGKESHEKCEVKLTPEIIHKLSNDLESNDLNSSNHHCKSSLKNESESKSLRKKCDSGYIEDVSVSVEKTIHELCEKMSSSSSYDESSDSALGPMTYQLSINSHEGSNSDSESIKDENKEVSSFETDTDESDVDFIEESQVSNIEMYVKEHFIPADVISKNFKSELNTELDQVNCDLEIAQLLSHKESDNNSNFENETEKSVKPDNEIVNSSEYPAAIETIKCYATEPTIIEKDINSHVQQETLMSEFDKDIITEVTDQEKEQFFNETLSTNDISSSKSDLENNIVNCDNNPLDLMQPLIAKIVLLTTDSCLAETKIGSRNQAIYFLKSVFSCNQHDSCTYCFESLCVGEEVSCFVPLPEISHKTWVAFMVSKDDSIKNERINCVNAMLQNQMKNDLSIGNENLFQKRGNFSQSLTNSVFKGISKTVPTHGEAQENRAYDISSLNTDFTNKDAAKSIYADKRRNLESQLHNAEFNVNCDTNCFSVFNGISSPVETKEAEIVVNGWKSHRKESKALDMKCSTVQNHLPEEECHKISMDKQIDKTDVACQTSCFNLSTSVQTEIQLKELGCQTDDSTKLSVSRANQTDNAILNEVMCQTELSGEVKAAIQTVSASCQTFSTGQIMITEYYHH